MANLQPKGKRRKLTVNGQSQLADQYGQYPSLSKVLADKEKTEMLEGLLRGARLLAIEEEVSIKLKEVMQRLECLSKMQDIVGRRPTAKQLEEHTAARLMEEYPPLGAHFMNLMGNAIGYDELLGQLVTHHNYESLEPGDINDLIYQTEELRTTFRKLSEIHKAKTAAPAAAA